MSAGGLGVCVDSCVCDLCVSSVLPPQLNTPALHSPAFFLFLYISLSTFLCLFSSNSTFFFRFISASSLIAADYFTSPLSVTPHILPHVLTCISTSMCVRMYKLRIHPSDVWSFIYTEHEKWLTVREKERQRELNIDPVSCGEAVYPSVFQTWRQTTVSVTLTPPAADEHRAAQETLSTTWL